MPVYTLDVILKDSTDATSDSDFRNDSWTLGPAGYSTLTISDDDEFGLGDNNPATETNNPAVITAVDGDASHPLVGQPIFAKFVRVDDGDGDTDNLADVVFLGPTPGTNSVFAVTAYPDSGWSMNVGDTFDATADKTPTDHGNRSWSQEGFVGNMAAPCFTPGSIITTRRGSMLIENLQEDEMVLTRDNGFQPMRWLCARALDRAYFNNNPEMKPVMIKAGALGDGIPLRDWVVSPGHLVLIVTKNEEAFIPARRLLGRPGIYEFTPDQTEYIHLLFDTHQVLHVDGAWSESFQPGPAVISQMHRDTQAELFALFPDLATEQGLRAYKAARKVYYAGSAKRFLGNLPWSGRLQ